MNLIRKPFIKLSGLAVFCCLLVQIPETIQAQSWETLTIPTTETQRSIHFISANEGWSAGYNGTILYTSNSGSNWSTQTSNTTERFLAIRFLDENNGWVGAGRLILRTTDGGQTWNDIEADPAVTKFRNSLFPVTSTVAWAPANSSGVIPSTRWFSRYTSNGTTIEEDFNVIESSAQFYGMYFTDVDNGWAVGSPGQIVRIFNASSGSPSFSYQTSGTSSRLNGIFMLDANIGWIVGYSGTILKTTNGGSNWTPLTSGTSTNLRDVHFVNSNDGWAVGDNGLILVTDNGGATWGTQISNVSTTLWSVFLINPGFIAGGDLSGGTNGVVLRTEQPSSIKIVKNSDKLKSFQLYQNYPNPFNPKTVIGYQLPVISDVELSIYNILGQKVATLVSAKQLVGNYKVEWDAGNFASGIYYYRLSTDKGFMSIKKLILLK